MSPGFRKYTTFVSILDYSYYIALMAIGVAFPLMTGGVDLSIGTGLICYSLVGGYLIVHQGWPTAAGMLVSILMGVAIGVLNGVLVAIMDLPAFLATLCTSMIARGIGTIVVGGFGIPWPVAGSPEGWFRNIFKIKTDGMNIPIGFLWIILLVILMTFVLNHTRIGRYTLAIGSNKEATRLSGVNVKFYHIMAYVICGFFAGLAAISYSAIFATVQPGSGAGFELEAIRWSNHRWRIHDRWCGKHHWYTCRCIRNLSVKDRTSFHRTDSKLAADHHRFCIDRSCID